MAKKEGTIYLLHFSRRYQHAGHYLGYVNGDEKELQTRLERHRKGDGARLLAVITAADITFEVVRIWKGSRSLERQLKKRKCSPKLCPLCQKEKKHALPR